MAEATFDVTYVEERNRMTNAFRMILAIPHMIVYAAWGYFANLLAVVQWFIVLFTGTRNLGIFNLQNAYVGYGTRVNAYTSLMIDPYPPFGTEVGDTGVTYALEYEAEADRLSNALRIFYLIPAVFILIFVSIGAFVFIVISWFAIIITGKQSQSSFAFLRRWLAFSTRVTTYAGLMTDTYPKFV
jgi:hypothetical protein